ncbi:MAG TPA: biotin/lipoyl-containing protein [Anaerolineales bacterium]|nr:biotin/lipoyl-containing protein [Anaerolineales bacterium]
MKYVTTIAEREFVIEILDDHHVALNGVVYVVDFESVSERTVYSLLVNNQSFEGSVYPSDEGWQVLLHGSQYVLQVEDEREKRLRASMGGELPENIDFHLRAPMPGLVVAIPISEGQAVQKGDVLIILESMKMQNELKSPRPGRISRVRVKPGDSVEHKETLLSVV